MNSARRKRRPWEGRRLAVAFVLAACVCGGVSCGGSGATKEPSKEIIIFCAGSLHKPISRVAEKYKAAHASATVLIEPTGSRVAIRKWTDLGRPVDVIAVADSRLIVSEAMPEHADWCLDFTGNRMVVAYTERSLHAAEINENNWFEVLSRPKVQVGRSDENLDPCGYRALMVMQLADLHYPAEKRGRVSIFESIGANIGRNNVRPKALDLQSLLQSKQLDYAFEYLSFAVQHNLEYVSLPDEINLGNPDFEKTYARSSVQVTGKKRGEKLTYTGATITYGLTIPRAAPHGENAERFVEFMLGPEGEAVFREMGMPFYPACRLSGRNVPERLRKFLSAAEK